MSKTILICDDDQDILEMLTLIFDNGNTNVIAVLNSLEVRTQIDRYHPDVVLLDLWMPVLTGDQIIRQLRAEDAYKNLPIVVMSASTDGGEIAKKSGATAYVSKPFDLFEIESTIRRYL
ncbi:response regulator [Niabella aquatica]